MTKLIALTVLMFVFLISSISFAGDKLSPSDKDFLFSTKQDATVTELDKAEIQATTGKIIIINSVIGGLLTVGIIVDGGGRTGGINIGIDIAVGNPNE